MDVQVRYARVDARGAEIVAFAHEPRYGPMEYRARIPLAQWDALSSAEKRAAVIAALQATRDAWIGRPVRAQAIPLALEGTTLTLE